MTSPRKISIYLPEDVAEQLDGVENASAYIAEALRMRRRRDATGAVLRDAGYLVTEAGVAKMRERVHAMDAMRAREIAAGEQ